VANAGPTQYVAMGSFVTLDGSASSDADNNPLTYTWTLTTKPAGSAAGISNASAIKPTFLADVAGTYVATLVVNDGTANSTPATVSILSVSDLSLLFSKSSGSSAIIINNYIQAGSKFSLSITNISSNSTFQVTKFELTNGATVVASTTDVANLNNGQLLPGESTSLPVTINVAIPNNGLRATYYLTDPISNTSFTVFYDWVL
jgi:hypothetical protein